jgi:transposase
MSTRVYLSKNDFCITREKDTPVSLRIQLSRATVKDLYSRLQYAYQHDAVRLVRRATVLIALLVHHVPVAVLGERWGLSPAWLYAWQKAFLLHGLDSLLYHPGGGRRPTWTRRQKKRLVELVEAGPQAVGCETACWDSVLIRVLIWREFGVLYNRHDVCTLLHNLGFSVQKARFVSDHLDAAKRLAWLVEQWPAIFRAAKRCKGLLLFEDEASFAQWGSLSYTWARRGRQPEVPTSGKRKGYKVFGAIEYFSGRLFYQGIESRFNSDSYQAFVQMLLEQTTAPLFLIHDGARYHTSQATQQCLQRHCERITVYPLPSYSPDYTPIEYLWKNTKKRATHNQYFKEFAALTVSVDKALAYFATHPETVSGLFGPYCQESGLELKQAA